nr:ABC transporter substrate-binding protein [Streptomyces sp. NBC_00995]
MGTGPFTFRRWQRDHELRLAAYDHHWQGRPHVDDLVFAPAPNSSSALAALQSGGVDIVAGMTPDAAQQLAGYPGVRIDHHTGIRTSYLSLDTLTEGPLLDRRVRQALNHAVDVPLLIKAVLGGNATEVPAMIPRGAFGFDKSVKPYERSLAKARALLAGAGHPDGISTSITASNLDANVAEAISGLLARAGIRTKVNLLDPGTYSQRLTSSNHGALGPMYLAASTVWTMDGPQDPVTGTLGDTIEEQTRQVLANVSALLATDGLTLDDVVKATVHLQDVNRDFAGFDRVYREHFADPRPVRTTVGSELMGILVEIDVVALRRSP